MLPPPAPTVVMSIIGTLSGNPAILYSRVTPGRPSVTRHTSVLVPPISKVIVLRKPASSAAVVAPTTPAAGPDRIIFAAWRRIAWAGMVPPLACTMVTGPRKSRCAQPVLEAGQVAVHDGLRVGADDGCAGALVLAKLRQDVGGPGDGHPGQRRGERLFGGDLVHGVGVRVEKADRDRLDALLADQPRDMLDEGKVPQRPPDGAVGPHALVGLDDVVAGDERLRLPVEQVEQARLGLPLDQQHVAEALRGDEARAGALVLEHRVRHDGRAVDQRGDLGRRHAAFGHRRQHRALRLRRRGHDFAGRLDMVAPGQHPVGEGAAGFNAEPEPDHTSSLAKYVLLHTLRYRDRTRGSSRSRSPSPSTLNASTRIEIASPRKVCDPSLGEVVPGRCDHGAPFRDLGRGSVSLEHTTPPRCLCEESKYRFAF